MRFKGRAAITRLDANRLRRKGVEKWFRGQAQTVAKWELYDSFYEHGWTNKLAKQIRHKLAPTIVRAVAIAWTAALYEVEAGKKS